MRANRSRDTGPELALRSALHRRGLRFRKEVGIRASGAERPIRADIVFPRQRIAVFVDGCFWHGCPEHGELPVANRDYWHAKFQRNVDRDHRNTAALTAAGWQVVRIWEHTPVGQAVDAVVAALSRR